jgi:tetratricopeptide (TPR) repeat protein
MGEERWEYAEAVLRDLGIAADRDDPTFGALLDSLEGHPLMMQIVLAKLGSPGVTPRGLHDSISRDGRVSSRSPNVLEARLSRILELFEDALPRETQELLINLNYFERHVDADDLRAMWVDVRGSDPQAEVTELLRLLTAAGLTRHIGNRVYEMHPALSGHIRVVAIARYDAQARQNWDLAFTRRMWQLASLYGPLPENESRWFLRAYESNLYRAKDLAAALDAPQAFIAITQALALYAASKHRYREAISLYQSLTPYGEAYPEVAAVVDHQLGTLFARQGSLAKAEEYFRRAVAARETSGDLVGLASTQSALGALAMTQSKLGEAEQWFNKALTIRRGLGGDLNIAELAEQLAQLAELRDQIDDAERWYHQALDVARTLNDVRSVSRIAFRLGSIAQRKSDLTGAEDWFARSLRIDEQLGDDPGRATNYHQLGCVAHLRHDIESAQRWYLRALEITERLGNEAEQARTYHQLGTAAQTLGDVIAARAWYAKSLAIEERLGNQVGIAQTLYQLGLVAQEQGELRLAEQLLTRALETQTQSGLASSAARVHHALGTVAYLRGDMQAAEASYARALELNRGRAYDREKASTLYQLALVAMANRDPDQAERYARDAVEIEDTYNDMSGAARSCLLLSSIGEAVGDQRASGLFAVLSVARARRAVEPTIEQQARDRFIDAWTKCETSDRSTLEGQWIALGLGQLPRGIAVTSTDEF